MKTTIIFVLLAAGMPLASAADWQKYNETEERFDYLDRSTVVRKGGNVRSWSKVNFAEPQVFKGGSGDGTRYSSAMQFGDFDCKARELYMVMVNYYAGPDADGGVVQSEKPTPGERPAFMPVAPDSVGESWMKKVCGEAKRKK